MPTPVAYLDPETMMLIDLVHSFNVHLLPLFIPAHPPFSRSAFFAIYSQGIPVVLRRLSILLIKATTLGRLKHDVSVHPEILHHRGRAIAEVATVLSDPANLETGLILGAILMLRFADMQVSKSSDAIHGVAADQLIGKNGGIMKCCQDIPDVRPLLLGSMVLEIFDPATKPATSLDFKMMTKQLECIPVFSRYEDQLLRMAHVCPLPIFHAIIYTNTLRLHLSTDDDTAILHPQTYSSILNLITSFDPSTWANTVMTAHHPRPHPLPKTTPTSTREKSAWTALATTYQTSALLYLLLSTPPGPSATLPTPPPSPTNPTHTALHQTLLATKSHLLTSIHYLFSLASSNPDDALETQLWKYLHWPLSISPYVKAAFGLGDESVQTELGRLRRVAGFLGARPLWMIVGEVERMGEAGVKVDLEVGKDEWIGRWWRMP